MRDYVHVRDQHSIQSGFDLNSQRKYNMQFYLPNTPLWHPHCQGHQCIRVNLNGSFDYAKFERQLWEKGKVKDFATDGWTAVVCLFKV